MAKKRTSYKIFGGKKYYFADWTTSKVEARKKAEGYRQNNFLARIVKEKSSSQYHIYIS